MTTAQISLDLSIFLIDSNRDQQLLFLSASPPGLIRQSTRQASHWESGTCCRAIDARYRLPLGRCSGMCKIPQLRRKPGQASARIRYAAGRASRSVSSWMPTAIFVRADEYCRL
jgi:hypothetical protein